MQYRAVKHYPFVCVHLAAGHAGMHRGNALVLSPDIVGETEVITLKPGVGGGAGEHFGELENRK